MLCGRCSVESNRSVWNDNILHIYIILPIILMELKDNCIDLKNQDEYGEWRVCANFE